MPYSLLISLPNVYKVKVMKLGDVIITPKIILHKFLYVSSFKYNCISVNSMSYSLKCIVLFTNALCLLRVPFMKRPRVIGSSRDELYFLCFICLKHSNEDCTSATTLCGCFPSGKSLISSADTKSCFMNNSNTSVVSLNPLSIFCKKG